MEGIFDRTELLLGKEAVKKLKERRVAVFGLGGVGSWAVEALCRSGIGKLELVDGDIVSASNINRQLPALHSTLGRCKAEVMAERARDINPEIEVRVRKIFFTPENAGSFDFSEYDYAADAVDDVPAKIELALRARSAGVPLISSMGAGGRLTPSRFEVMDIYETSACPLARAMRIGLRRRGVQNLKVVCSKEPPLTPALKKSSRGPFMGSTVFAPAAAGLLLASEIVKDLLGL